MPIGLRFLLFYINYLAPQFEFSKVSPEQIRRWNQKELKKSGWLLDFAGCEMETVRDAVFTARDGAAIGYRYYRPKKLRNRAVILFFHGGGFVTRNLDSHDKACRRLAQTNQMPVISVDYRLAPEYKFPIPVYDSYDAFQWLIKESEKFDVEPDKIIVMGDSAGANLATVVSILSRESGGPAPWRQVLIYPTVDARLQYPSITSLGKGYFLTKSLIEWFVHHYKRTDDDILNPLMSPILAEDLSGLPPAYLCTADLDPLRDEGLAYAQRLEQAGVPTTYRNYESVIHGFLNLRRLCYRQNEQLHQDIAAFLNP